MLPRFPARYPSNAVPPSPPPGNQNSLMQALAVVPMQKPDFSRFKSAPLSAGTALPSWAAASPASGTTA